MNKNKQPLITIIIPIYNAEKTLERTLKSVLHQTYKNFEVLMIDDSSRDKSKEIASTYTKDKRFKLISLDSNAGVANARNVGIDSSNGEYICFLDSDDWWETEKLNLQITKTLDNNFLLSYMTYQRIEEDTLRVFSCVKPPKSLTYKNLLRSNHIGNLTTMIKKSVIGNTRFKKTGHEDYIFWLDILKKGITAYLINTEKIQCNYLVRKTSLSSNKFKAIKWQWSIYRKNEKLNYLQSFFFTTTYIINALKKRK